jgi:hypothetical protein
MITITTNKRTKHLFGKMAIAHFMAEVDGDEEEHYISGVAL